MTNEQFKVIATSLDWRFRDIPRKDWEILGLQRLQHTFAVMGSASITNPRVLNDIEAVAGMDVLVSEAHPMVHKGEPSGNAYHWVVQKTDHPQFPYILHGPFPCQTLVPHWFMDDDITVYWSNQQT